MRNPVPLGSPDLAGAPAVALGVFLGVIGAVALYILAECVYRLYRYRQLKGLAVLPRVRLLEAPLIRFDSQQGFRYIPNTTVRHTTLDAANRISYQNVVRANNHGHISPRNDFVEKPPDEFRIALLGDSFTACVFSNCPWSIVVEDSLNEDAALLAALGKGKFKVLNFGMAATGFVQWPLVYEHDVAQYRPDLVVVAFIEHDIWRDFKWMDTVRPYPGAGYQLVLVSPSQPVRLENPRVLLGREVVMPSEAAQDPEVRQRWLKDALDRKLRAMPWWAPHPELLGLALERLGVPQPDILVPRLSYRPDSVSRWGSVRRWNASVAAMQSLAARGPTLFVHLPTRSELASEQPSPLLAQLRSTQPELALARAHDHLPSGASEEHMDRWFLKGHGHLTDAGTAAYGEAIATVVRAHLVSSARNRQGATRASDRPSDVDVRIPSLDPPKGRSMGRSVSRSAAAAGRVVGPIALGILFYGVLTPLAVVMRLTGKDRLRLKRDPGADSYWIPRRPPGPPPDSMTRQF